MTIEKIERSRVTYLHL